MNTNALATFRGLHRPGQPLVLPNVWDAGSARIVAAAGASAVATTSGGVAWALGLRDGGALRPADQVSLAPRLVGACDVPVSMDVENGYSTEPADVAALLVELAELGVAGVNLEDSSNGAQRAADEFASFLAEIRSGLASAGHDIFVNARVDSWLLGTQESVDDVLGRCRTYVDAGADGIFVPGLADLATIARLCEQLEVPVNVMSPAGARSVQELAEVGVARISAGTGLAEAVWSTVDSQARAMLAGDLPTREPDLGYGALNDLMRA